MSADPSDAATDAGARAEAPASLLQALLRHVVLVLVVVAVGVGLGALLPAVRDGQPVARVDLLLDAPARTLTNSPEAVALVREQAVLARLPAVTQAAADAAGVTLQEATSRLRVGLPETTARLRFTYRAPDEQTARLAVDAAVVAYGDLRRRQLEQTAASTRRRAEDAAAALRAAPRTAAVTQAREALARRAGEAAVVTAGAQGDPLRLPTEVESTAVPRLRGAVSGGLAGALVALAAAHAAAVRQRRARGTDAPRTALSAPRLGSLRRFRLGRLQSDDPAGEGADLCRGVLVAIGLAREADDGPPLIAVVDATEEGFHGSTFAADLAVAAADWQQHVLLVTGPASTARALLEAWDPDAEPQPQDGHRPGVVDVLEEGQPWDAPTHPWDLVLADAPALLGNGRAAGIAVHADVVVAAVPRGSDVRRLVLLRRRLDELDLPLVGFVELVPLRLRDLLPAGRVRRRSRLRPARSLARTG